jgi:hypothetical protein
MKIFGRNPAPDHYSIKKIRIGYDKNRCRVVEDGTEKWLADLYLLVDLEPQPYMRSRFVFGQSYETKKNPCTLRIDLSELREMQQAASGKLEESFQFLLDNGLLNSFVYPETAKETKKAG